MGSALAAKSEEKKKSRGALPEDAHSETPLLQHSGGATAGLPRFLSGGSGIQVQAKCAKCQEEEEKQAPVAVQAKCACCGGGSCRHDREPAGIHSTAREGVAGASQPLPHLDRIQSSFGRHDIGGARAQVGGPAAEANQRMGSLAYTAGDRIAFDREPDVKLAAHEAAHVVQQRSGAKLPGGVGRPGDEYEQQADAAANAVDRGESAEPILDRASRGAPSGSAPVVQHRLQVNAFHLSEPPMAAPHAPPEVGTGTGAVREAGAPKAASGAKGPAQEGPQAGRSAIAQASQGEEKQPETPAAPAPAGGVEAQTAGAGFNPHCYRAGYDEPKDSDDDNEPPEPDTTKPKEEVRPDLPRPKETDICPVENALAAAVPSAPGPAAAQQAGPGAAHAAPASPHPAGHSGGQAEQAGSHAAPAGGAPAGAVKDNAKAAASAPSPLEAAIAQSEAGRDGAVAAFAASDDATGAWAPRIAALSAEAHFLPEAAVTEESRAAEARVSDFFKAASARLAESLSLATDVVPSRFGAAAETIKGQIGAAIDQQKNSVSAGVGVARAQTLAAAAAARSRVHGQYDATVASVAEKTAAAIHKLEAAHKQTIAAVGETESLSLAGVNRLYSTSYDAHVALGPAYADRADARGEQYAEFYNGCKKYNADGTPWKDGFFAGYLTNRRAEAEVKAARETAKGYRKSLIETANDQGAQAMKGRRKDRCGIIAAGRTTRTAADGQLASLTEALHAGQRESVAEAASTRHMMLASIESGLASAMAVLDLLEHDGRQSLDDTGYLQQLAIEQAAHASATAVQESVMHAAGNVERALLSVRAALAETPAPAPGDVDQVLTQAAAGLNGGVDMLLASVQGSLAAATARLDEAGGGALAALGADAQASFGRITAQTDSFSSQMGSLASGAAAAFGAMRTQYAAQTQQIADAGAAGFTQATAGFEKTCQTMLAGIGKTLGESEQGLEKNFAKQIAGLDSEATGIPMQARTAASKEQPAWKSVVAIILIIAIIIVVALVIGPAVIGAVGAAAAALGASAGVATAVGAIVGGAIVGALSSGAMTVVQNWASGQRLTKGLGRAMAVGALTGAIGGAVGLGVNAGLNAVVGAGGRLAMSAGAQFAVRAAVNLTSDALMNIGQQMVLSGHVDWGEFAQGVAMSLVLHGSRRVQAFQARMTAAGAGGVSRIVSAVGTSGEPGTPAARASEYAGQLKGHAVKAAEESTKPLDWTPPKRATELATAPPSEAGQTTPPAKTEAAPAPPEPVVKEVPPPAPVREAEPAAAKPVAEPEPAAAKAAREPEAPPVTKEGEPQAAAVPAEEPAAARPGEEHPLIGKSRKVQLAGEEHTLSIRRLGRRLVMILCSNQCGEIIFKVRRLQARVARGTPQWEALESLAQKAQAADQIINGVKPGSPPADVAAADAELTGLRDAMTEIQRAYPELIDPDVPLVVGGPVAEKLSGQRIQLADHMPANAKPVGKQQTIDLSTADWEVPESLLDAQSTAAAKGKQVEFIYAVRDNVTGEILKIGETADIETRADVYERAARLHAMGRKISVEVQAIELESGDTAAAVEGVVRRNVLRGIAVQRGGQKDPSVLPWDNSVPGRSRPGIPGVTDPKMREPVEPGSKETSEFWWRETIWSRKDSGPAPERVRQRPDWAPSDEKLGQALADNDGNVTAAARQLSVPRTTLIAYMKAWGLTVDKLMALALARTPQ